MEVIRHYRPEKVRKYEARWYVDRKLKCRFFATEEEREAFIAQFTKTVRRQGEEVLRFDSGQMRRWEEASKLAPDADPVEVMRFWLASHRPRLREKRLGEAAAAYLAMLAGVGRTPGYRKHVEATLEDFRAQFGDRPVHDFQTGEISDYIFSKPFSPVTKRHYRMTLTGAFSWWQEQGWAADNPVKRIRPPQVVVPEPGILPVDEMAHLFAVNAAVDPEVCALLALGAFAGMRTSAISRVAFEEIDFTQRGILTPAEKTKKRRRQWIEGLPDVLWAWLKRAPREAFSMTPRHFLHRRSEAYKRAGLLIEQDDIDYENRKRTAKGQPPVSWQPKAPPKNALRHSFVTYHVALHRDPGRTALLVGHRNQEVLFRHYLGIATRDAAERYFAIRPPE